MRDGRQRNGQQHDESSEAGHRAFEPTEPGGGKEVAVDARVDASPRPRGSDSGLRAHTLTQVSNVVEMNAPTRRRRRSSRTALVLGGGGFTGGVYQIGALRALDLLSSNRSVNQFDIYV